MSKGKWINNFGKMFKSANGSKFIKIELAESVTLKLNRFSKATGKTVEEVTLTPQVDDRGNSYVFINVSSPREGFKISDSHLADLSVPPAKD